MTAHTPELSALHVAGDMDRLRLRFAGGLRLILVVAIPATVGMILLAGPLIRVILEHGEFTMTDADTTANTLVALLCGLPAFSLFLFAMRGFYAQRDTRLPFYVNLAETILGLIVAFLVVDRFGVVGLGASGSIAYSVFAIVALILLHRRIGSYLDGTTAAAVLKIVVATAVMGACVRSIDVLSSFSDLVTLIVAGTMGAVIYVSLLLILGVREARSIAGRVLSR